MRIAVCPVNDATQLIPFIQAAKTHTVAKAQRHFRRYVYVVRDQERLTIARINHETLVFLALEIFVE